MKKRVTLRDVAAAAGVHVSTVSRALDPKTRHLITPEVVTHILKLSEQLAYRPNAAAYSLKTNRSRTVGIIVPDITNPVFPPIIRGAEDALAQQNYVAILGNTDGSPQREEEIIETMRARGVEGLLLASVKARDTVVDRLAAEGVPMVTVNRRVDDPGTPSVVHDERDGTSRILNHLVGLGHRQIAYIAGPQDLSTGRDRYLAFEEGRAALGLEPDANLVAVADTFNESAGERCAEELLARDIAFTAIVCANDLIAIGAISALRRHGLSCPEDVSVTGYNDMPLADRLLPPLTTIRVEQHKAGHAAAELLLEALSSPPGERVARHLVLPVQMIIRGSTQAVSPSGGNRKPVKGKSPARRPGTPARLSPV
jgi:LacI family transcriptional regulator